MMTLLGWLIVTGAVFGGFIYSGGNPQHLIVLGEYMVILGVVLGYIVGATPMHTLKLMLAKILQSLKGTPFTKEVYLDLVKVHYELLMVAREQGVVGIEEHVMNPAASPIFSKYGSFINNHHAVVFMQDALKPIIDGRLKAEQLKESLVHELDKM
jgi:chemotaxis protein MotA